MLHLSDTLFVRFLFHSLMRMHARISTLVGRGMRVKHPDVKVRFLMVTSPAPILTIQNHNYIISHLDRGRVVSSLVRSYFLSCSHLAILAKLYKGSRINESLYCIQ